MKTIEHKLSLEIFEHSADPGIVIPQGDSSRSLQITLTKKGEIYEIPENSRPVFTALKPDGAVIFNEAALSENRILHRLSPQTTAVAGTLRCQLRLYGYDGELLISPGFSLLISEAVYNEGDEIESRDELSALTGLVTETNELIDTIRQSLTEGDFTPSFTVGSVSTLPHGEMAAVELTGTKAAPILNFAIPQGPQGQAESLIPDSQLSLNSTKPVQNTVITAALNQKLDKSEFELSSKNFVQNEVFSDTLSNFVELEEIGNYLETKVDKISGMGLSSNDFTDAEKSKLSGISPNANNYSLPALGVGSTHLANAAVTEEKIAANAVTESFTLTLPAENWQANAQTLSAEVAESDTLIVSPAPQSHAAWCEAGVYCSGQSEKALTFACSAVPAAALTVNVTVIKK